MTTHTARRHRPRRPPVRFVRAHTPLRRVVQGRVRDTREPQLRQLEYLTAEDRPPVAVQRGRYYRAVPPDLPARWHPPIATVLGLLVAFVILYSLR